jgi:hypothetical protein
LSSQQTLKNLVIEDSNGVAQRMMRWNGEAAFLIQRQDRRRLEIVSSVESLEKQKIKFDIIQKITDENALVKGLALPRSHQLRLVKADPQVPVSQVVSTNNERQFQILFAGLIVFGFLFQWGVKFVPPPTDSMQKELVRQMVKIVKPQKVEQRTAPDANMNVSKASPQKVALKRMGALAVLGSLKSSTQKGGLNLGAAQTSRGVGLGGTQGSGGVQSSIYAKGLIAAPLGTGGNVQGAGGYGTKGKGGGQAGYGSTTLVGSAGTEALPLGRDAIIGGGLDREAISEVVRRNQGQVMFCYEQGLQVDPKLAGRVAIKWVIDGNGQVKAAGIENTTLNSKIIEDCILARLKSWRFPLPQGGVEVSVSYPFMLKRAG